MFSFGFCLFLLQILFFRPWFFELAFHLVLSLVRATISVVVLVFCANVPAIGLARLVFGHKPQTWGISRFLLFSASLVLRRVVLLDTVGRARVVFRLLPSAG